jgi:hypothetical protein
LHLCFAEDPLLPLPSHLFVTLRYHTAIMQLFMWTVASIAPWVDVAVPPGIELKAATLHSAETGAGISRWLAVTLGRSCPIVSIRQCDRVI